MRVVCSRFYVESGMRGFVTPEGRILLGGAFECSCASGCLSSWQRREDVLPHRLGNVIRERRQVLVEGIAMAGVPEAGVHFLCSEEAEASVTTMVVEHVRVGNVHVTTGFLAVPAEVRTAADALHRQAGLEVDGRCGLAVGAPQSKNFLVDMTDGTLQQRFVLVALLEFFDGGELRDLHADVRDVLGG